MNDANEAAMDQDGTAPSGSASLIYDIPTAPVTNLGSPVQPMDIVRDPQQRKRDPSPAASLTHKSPRLDREVQRVLVVTSDIGDLLLGSETSDPEARPTVRSLNASTAASAFVPDADPVLIDLHDVDPVKEALEQQIIAIVEVDGIKGMVVPHSEIEEIETIHRPRPASPEWTTIRHKRNRRRSRVKFSPEAVSATATVPSFNGGHPPSTAVPPAVEESPDSDQTTWHQRGRSTQTPWPRVNRALAPVITRRARDNYRDGIIHVNTDTAAVHRQFFNKRPHLFRFTQEEDATSLFLFSEAGKKYHKPADVVVDDGAKTIVMMVDTIAAKMGLTWSKPANVMGVGGPSTGFMKSDQVIALKLGGVTDNTLNPTPLQGCFTIWAKPLIMSSRDRQHVGHDIVLGQVFVRSALANIDFLADRFHFCPAWMSHKCKDFRVSVPISTTRQDVRVNFLRNGMDDDDVNLDTMCRDPPQTIAIASVRKARTSQPRASGSSSDESAKAKVQINTAAMHPGFPQRDTIPTRAEYLQDRAARAERNRANREDGPPGFPTIRERHAQPTVIDPVGITYSLKDLKASGRLRDNYRLDISGTSTVTQAELQRMQDTIVDTVLQRVSNKLGKAPASPPKATYSQALRTDPGPTPVEAHKPSCSSSDTPPMQGTTYRRSPRLQVPSEQPAQVAIVRGGKTHTKPSGNKLNLSLLIAKATAKTKAASQKVLLMRVQPYIPAGKPSIGLGLPSSSLVTAVVALSLPSLATAQPLSITPSSLLDYNLLAWFAYAVLGATISLLAFKELKAIRKKEWFGQKHILGTKTLVLLVPVIIIVGVASDCWPVFHNLSGYSPTTTAVTIYQAAVWVGTSSLLLGTVMVKRGVGQLLAILAVATIGGSLQSGLVVAHMAQYVNFEHAAAFLLAISFMASSALVYITHKSRVALQRK